MANLRVDKIASTETFETTGSVQFDGNSDYLETNKAPFQMLHKLTSSWTIESWIYLENPGAQLTVFDTGGSSSTTIGLSVYIDSQIKFRLRQALSSLDASISITHNLNYRSWHHLSVTFDYDTKSIRIFVDGKIVGSTTYGTESSTDSNRNFKIGAYEFGDGPTITGYLQGYISNMRVIDGKALYISNFKPSMRELEVVPGTVLLACQSKTDASLEKTGKTITVGGSAVANELTPGLLTPIVKSGGGSAITGSVEFSGTGEYLSITESNDFDFGADDFTMEYWYNEGNDDRTERRVLYCDDTTQAFMIGHTNDNGGQLFFSAHDSDNNLITGGIVRTTSNSNPTGKRNYWRHVAACREGATFRIFIDGVLQNTANFGTTAIRGDQNTLYIGQDPNNTTTRNFRGFLSNIRIVKGTALYTDDFIPPTRELKRVPGTVLLCCQDSNDPTQEVTGKTISLNGIYTYDTVVNSGITTAPTPSNFTPQVGDDRKVTFEGVTKINSDAYFYLPTGNTESREATGTYNAGTRGIFGGGLTPTGSASQAKIQYITISSTGDAQDFGDLTEDRYGNGALASNTRALWAAGLSSPSSSYYNTIDYVTIASTGNALDFGDITYGVPYYTAGVSNATRGIWGGGYNTPSSPQVPSPFPSGFQDEMEYITIASTGNAQDFGDFTARNSHSSFGSPTRGCFAGGASPGKLNSIEYITIASTGNAQDFGDLTLARNYGVGCSNAIRGLVGGGGDHPAYYNMIDYVTIATTGNAFDFGDLPTARAEIGGCSSATRGVFGGGWSPTKIDEMEYVEIATTGNSLTFGELDFTGVYQECGTSNGHGGLG